MSKQNILLICGGGGEEHEISLISANYIKEKMEISPNAINVMTPDGISRSLGMETQLKEKRILDLRPRT